jgi:vacuolar-type H+-ATPase subunit H
MESSAAWVESTADECSLNDAAQAAIAEVLAAERDARDAIGRARLEVNGIDEAARAAARALAERTERRVRTVADAFERQLGGRIAEIDAEATQLDIAQPLGGEETAALQRAVLALAHDLIGVRP